MGTTAKGELVRGGVGTRAKRTLVALQQFKDACVEQCRGAYLQAMRRVAVRRELHRFRRDCSLDRARSKAHGGEAPAMTFVGQLLRLYRAGATEAELTQLASFPQRAMRTLFGETRPLNELDSEETRLDGREDELQMRRRILMTRPAGISPQLLREEAEACASAAALYEERERALLAEADRIASFGGMIA